VIETSRASGASFISATQYASSGKQGSKQIIGANDEGRPAIAARFVFNPNNCSQPSGMDG
jgi:hypothetical protein